MRLIPAFFALLLLATACTPMEWVRPGTSLQQMQADSAECNDLAWQESQRMWLWDPWHPWFGYTRFGRSRWPYWGYGPDPMMWRMQIERDLYDFCMRARGYRLMPVPAG